MKIPPSSVSTSPKSSSESPPSSKPSSPSSSLEISIMEGKPSPHLKKVLKSYQLTAANTLSGPNSVLSRFEGGSSNSASNGSSNSSSASSTPMSSVGSTSAVNMISNTLAASHGSLVGGSPHYGLKIEKCVKGLVSCELQNNHLQTGSHQGPLKLSTVLKSRMNGGAGTGSFDFQEKAVSLQRDKGNARAGICIEREIKKEPEDEIPIKSSKSHHYHHHIHQEENELGEPVAAKMNGRSSATSFTTSDTSSDSSCSPANASSPVATINVNVVSNITSPTSSAPSVGVYPTRKDRLREHTPEEMIAATALAYVKELPPEALQVIHVESRHSPVVGGNGQLLQHHHQSIQRPGSSSDMPPPSTATSPSPQSIVYQPLPPPILSSPDRSRTEKVETYLEGEFISCFVIGGEKRLCFPQILTSVLRPFNLSQINQVCDELQIFCSRCSKEQLNVFKATQAIPPNAPSCGLITKTDAERLVNSLLHRNPPKSIVGSLGPAGRVRDPRTANSFRVYHECFGKCKGIVMPLMYNKRDALCVECVECQGLFSPIRFVAHSHRRQETRTCHWGFDTANWRHYLMLSRDQDDRERWEKALEEFKKKFEKRKESNEEHDKDLEEHLVIKKVRYNSPTPITPPTSLFESRSCLPTKKRLPIIQYSENDQTVPAYEMESVKKLVLSRMGVEGGADSVVKLLDKMAHRISSLEQICRTQEKTIRDITDPKCGAELKAKVNTMEAELHSLKMQLQRGQREEI